MVNRSTSFVRVAGSAPTREGAQSIQGNIAYVAQETGFFSCLTVHETLSFSAAMQVRARTRVGAQRLPRHAAPPTVRGNRTNRRRGLSAERAGVRAWLSLRAARGC
jgi:ABC-type branched-subunit amino acid transport system ATPase component